MLELATILGEPDIIPDLERLIGLGFEDGVHLYQKKVDDLRESVSFFHSKTRLRTYTESWHDYLEEEQSSRVALAAARRKKPKIVRDTATPGRDEGMFSLIY